MKIYLICLNSRKIETDFLTNDKIRKMLKENNIPFTLKKSKMLLKHKGCSEYRTSKHKGLIGLIYNDNDDLEQDFIN